MPVDESPEDLLSKAATCRRRAQTMGADPLARSLIEIAEGYEARAAALQSQAIVPNPPPLA
jgi:hypothetical protein